MTTEAWTLFGVVVGAILGGLAQVVSGHLQGQRERAREKRESTRELYLDALVFASTFNDHLTSHLVVLFFLPDQVGPYDEATKRGIFETFMQLHKDFEEFDRRLLILRAVGNKDVVDRLTAVREALRDDDGKSSITVENLEAIKRVRSAVDDLVEAIARAL